MVDTSKKWNVTLVLILIVSCILYRIIPHPLNFAPITAMALLSGSYLKSHKYLAFLIPLVALFASDLVLNNTLYRAFYAETGLILFKPYMIASFVSIAMIVLIGSLIKRSKFFHLVSASISSSAIFFIITNFSSWIELPMYPKSLTGLMECYVAGIPFFPFTLFGDLIFTLVLFGLAALATNKYYVPSLSSSKV